MTQNTHARINHHELNLYKVLVETGVEKYQREGLSRVCRALQKKQMNMSPELLITVLGVAHSPSREVRLWAVKVLAELGRRPDLFTLLSNMLTMYSGDTELESWIIGALISTSTISQIKDLIDSKSIPNSPFYRAVASMFGGEEAVNLFPNEFIELDHADAITLKWLCLMVGLERANPDLFSPKFENLDVLGNLTTHHDPIVSQYAFWGLCEHDSGNLSQSQVSSSNFSQLEPNVRNYAYRLLTKNHTDLSSDFTTFEEGTFDNSVEARRGLAKGIKDTWDPNIKRIILSWLSRETDPDVKVALFEHCASHAVTSSDYRDEVVSEYKKNGLSQLSIRTRLLSCVEGTELFAELRKLDIQEDMQKNRLSLFDGVKPPRASLDMEHLANCIWVIENDKAEQGTAFFLEGYGLVTAAHCIQGSAEVFNCRNFTNKYSVKVRKHSPEYDLVILEIPTELGRWPHQLKVGSSKVGEPVTLAGFPQYDFGQPLRVESGKLLRKFPKRARRLLEISPKIIAGNSGGPILNSSGDVIALASEGINNQIGFVEAMFLGVDILHLKDL